MHKPLRPTLIACSALIALAACDGGGFDPDFRGLTNGPDTSDAARNAVAPKPRPDDRGLITYDSYQVVAARRGDTVEAVANRVGLPAGEVAEFNGLTPETPLRSGEILALPRFARAPAGQAAPGGVDIAGLAGAAIDRADGGEVSTTTIAAPVQPGEEPVRHRVGRGETAFSIARLYDVSVRSLADWNGLGPDLEVREGQFLLIPVVITEEADGTQIAAAGPAGVAATATAAAAPREVTPPGEGTATPEPPSASAPLPDENVTAEPEEPPEPAQDLAATRTAATSSTFVLPVSGSIIRDFDAERNPGIDISAPAGTAVKAAEAGQVIKITNNTDQVPIVLVRHPNNLITVYAFVDDIAVNEGDSVSRGQQIARLRGGDQPFLHFEVREGFTPVDPTPYLN